MDIQNRVKPTITRSAQSRTYTCPVAPEMCLDSRRCLEKQWQNICRLRETTSTRLPQTLEAAQWARFYSKVRSAHITRIPVSALHTTTGRLAIALPKRKTRRNQTETNSQNASSLVWRQPSSRARSAKHHD